MGRMDGGCHHSSDLDEGLGAARQGSSGLRRWTGGVGVGGVHGPGQPERLCGGQGLGLFGVGLHANQADPWLELGPWVGQDGWPGPDPPCPVRWSRL
jgi:hypothetical protein